MDPTSHWHSEYALTWEMSVAERFALTGMIARLRPAIVLEIGTHFGGSLQVFAAHCDEVHSIDIDPAVRDNLAPLFPRVRFHVGDSAVLVSRILEGLQLRDQSPDFVLIDGDHSAAGVQRDIETILRYVPRRPMHLLLHDSFNPDCRAGMRRAAWSDCPYVHAVELDLVPGVFHAQAQGGAFARSMWGGFAWALLKPEKRAGSLLLGAAQEELHRLTFGHSRHRWIHKVWRAVDRRWRN